MLFPYWPDENAKYGEGEGRNALLDNLLHDIMHSCIDESVWEDPPGYRVQKNKEKRKKKMDCSSDDFVDPPKKKIERNLSNKKGKGKKFRDVSSDSEHDIGLRRRKVKDAGMSFGAMKGMMWLMTHLIVKVEGIGTKVDDMGTQMKSLQSQETKMRMMISWWTRMFSSFPS